MATTEGRDGGTAIALDHGAAVTLPPEATQDVLGDADRTVCMWARIDEWKSGCLFHYGGDGSQGTSSGGDGAGSDAVTGAATSYSFSYSYGGSSASRRRRRLAGSYSYSYSAETATEAHHTEDYAEQTFGLCAGAIEGQLEIVSGSRTVDLGRTIDWRVFHHFCLTYDGPSRGGNSDLTFYFDGDKRWTENVLLDTAPEGTYMRLGTDATYERPLTGALDEVYIYASALEASAIAVLYDDVTAAPTVTDAPTGDFFEGSLVAYYPFDDGLRDAAGAHHAWLLGATRRRRRLPRAAGGCYGGHRPRLRPHYLCTGTRRFVGRGLPVRVRRGQRGLRRRGLVPVPRRRVDPGGRRLHVVRRLRGDVQLHGVPRLVRD
jgi:hypothetical protein